MTPPDIQAVLDRGSVAADLLAHPAYTTAMQELENYHLTAMVSAPPGDTAREARDHHHLMLHALRELAEQLAMHVAAAAEAREALKDTDPQEDGEDDLLDGDQLGQ